MLPVLAGGIQPPARGCPEPGFLELCCCQRASHRGCRAERPRHGARAAGTATCSTLLPGRPARRRWHAQPRGAARAAATAGREGPSEGDYLGSFGRVAPWRRRLRTLLHRGACRLGASGVAPPHLLPERPSLAAARHRAGAWLTAACLLRDAAARRRQAWAVRGCLRAACSRAWPRPRRCLLKAVATRHTYQSHNSRAASITACTRASAARGWCQTSSYRAATAMVHRRRAADWTIRRHLRRPRLQPPSRGTPRA